MRVQSDDKRFFNSSENFKQIQNFSANFNNREVRSEGERHCCPKKKQIHVHEKFELVTYAYNYSYSWNLTYVQTLSLDIFAYHFTVQRPRVDILCDSQSTAHKNTLTVVWL